MLKRDGYHDNDGDIIFVKKLLSSNNEFNSSALFAVLTRKNYSKTSTLNQCLVFLK